MRWTLAKAALALFSAGALGLARPSQAQQSNGPAASANPKASPTKSAKSDYAVSAPASKTAAPSQAPYVSSGIISYEDTMTVSEGVITFAEAPKPPVAVAPLKPTRVVVEAPGPAIAAPASEV